MKLLLKMLKKRAGLSALTVGAGVLAVAVSLWWNAELSAMIDAIDGGAFLAIGTIMGVSGAIAANAGAAWAAGLLSGWTCETLAHDLRMGYARNLSALPLAEIENLAAGERLSALQNEVADISAFLRDGLFAIVYDGIRFAATLAFMLCLNPRLAVLANLPVLLTLWYTTASSRAIEGAARRSQQANGEMNGFADMLVTTFPVLRLFNAAPLLCGKYGEALKRWETLSITEERTKARLMSASAALSCLPLLLLFLVGGLQAMRGETTVGTVYVFINLSGNVSGVLMNLPGRAAAFRRFSANMGRISGSVLLTEGGDGHTR